MNWKSIEINCIIIIYENSIVYIGGLYGQVSFEACSHVTISLELQLLTISYYNSLIKVVCFYVILEIIWYWSDCNFSLNPVADLGFVTLEGRQKFQGCAENFKGAPNF